MTITLGLPSQQDVEDPLEQMLKKTGCIELHYQLQDCMAKFQDWRKCQDLVKKFKVCMTKHQKEREEGYS